MMTMGEMMNECLRHCLETARPIDWTMKTLEWAGQLNHFTIGDTFFIDTKIISANLSYCRLKR